MTFRTAALPVALAAVLLTVGCTGAEPEPTPTPSATTAPPTVTDIQDAPGSGGEFTGAVADTTVECAAGDDGWAASGTVTNPTDGVADYRIYVSFLDAAGGTRGVVQVDVDGVAAGASQDWQTTAALPDEELSCVLRVERYAVG